MKKKSNRILEIVGERRTQTTMEHVSGRGGFASLEKEGQASIGEENQSNTSRRVGSDDLDLGWPFSGRHVAVP